MKQKSNQNLLKMLRSKIEEKKNLKIKVKNNLLLLWLLLLVCVVVAKYLAQTQQNKLKSMTSLCDWTFGVTFFANSPRKSPSISKLFQSHRWDRKLVYRRSSGNTLGATLWEFFASTCNVIKITTATVSNVWLAITITIITNVSLARAQTVL